MERAVFSLTSPFQKNSMECMESRMPGPPSSLPKTKLSFFPLVCEGNILQNANLLNCVALHSLFLLFCARKAFPGDPLHPKFHHYYCLQKMQYFHFTMMPSPSGSVFCRTFLRSATTWPFLHSTFFLTSFCFLQFSFALF